MSVIKNSIKKILSILLCLIMCFTPLLTLSAAAQYPAHVSEQDCLEAIPKLDKLILSLLKSNEQTQDLQKSVYGALCTDETLNSVFAAVYKEIGANSSSMSIIGVDLSPQTLAARLALYEDVSKKISACSTLDEVINASASFKWGVNDKNGFASAVAAMFSPFNSLLYTVLCGGSLQINALMSIRGDNGYENAIVPLLNAMDSPSVLSQADFSAKAKENNNSMVANIVLSAFAAVDKILENPVSGICTALPTIAYFIDSGRLSQSINTLVEPLSLRIGIFTIPGISSLLSSVTELESGFDISTLLKNVDLSSLTGSDIQLNIPEINIEELAACVKTSGNVVSADKAAALLTVLRWLIEAVKLNKTQLLSFMGAQDGSEIIDTFLNKDADVLIKLLTDLLTAEPQSTLNNFQWSYPAFTPVSVAYTATLTRENYEKVLNEIDSLLDEIAAESEPQATIESVLTKQLYSNSSLSSLVCALYSALAFEQTAPLFSLLGANVSPAGIADALSGSFPTAARTLRAYASWEDVKPEALSWGFSDGNKSSFKSAVTAVLSPFEDIFRFLLAEGQLTLFDAITLYGSNGYETAIIPLLEALSCESDDIKSYAQYLAEANSSLLISNITEPLFSLIDDICKRPVYSLCSILPNALYFINGGGLNTIIENLLFPISEFLKQTDLSELLPESLGSMADIDIASSVSSLISSAELPIALPELDLAQFSGLGTAETLTSKRVQNAAPAAYTYIRADGPAVLITLLRYIVGALALEENADLLSGFMSSEGGDDDGSMPDMMSMYAGNITEQFKTMTTDEIIEWLYNLLFRETPKVEKPGSDGDIPTVIYKEPEKSPVLPAILIIAALALALFIGYRILLRRGALDGLIEKRRAKKKLKAAKKEAKKLKKQKGKSLSPFSGQKKKAPLPPDGGALRREQNELLLPLSDGSAKKGGGQKGKTEQSNQGSTAQNIQKSAYVNSLTVKEAEKLYRRQTRAANRALRNTKKADKYYAKALIDSKKKK